MNRRQFITRTIMASVAAATLPLVRQAFPSGRSVTIQEFKTNYDTTWQIEARVMTPSGERYATGLRLPPFAHENPRLIELARKTIHDWAAAQI